MVFNSVVSVMMGMIPICLGPADAASSIQVDEKPRGSIWISSGLFYEFPRTPDLKHTFGAGFGLVAIDSDSSDFGDNSYSIAAGPAIEGFYRPSGPKDGITFGGRAGFAGGRGYIAPAVLWEGKFVRAGFFFPLGKDVNPVLFELGWRVRL